MNGSARSRNQLTIPENWKPHTKNTFYQNLKTLLLISKRQRNTHIHLPITLVQYIVDEFFNFNKGFFLNGKFKFDLSGKHYRRGRIIMTEHFIYKLKHYGKEDVQIDWNSIERICILPEHYQERIIIQAKKCRFLSPISFSTYGLYNTFNCDTYFLHKKHVENDLASIFVDIQAYYVMRIV